MVTGFGRQKTRRTVPPNLNNLTLSADFDVLVTFASSDAGHMACRFFAVDGLIYNHHHHHLNNLTSNLGRKTATRQVQASSSTLAT
ncbi:hypothetical protein CF326_g5211 [Tilletia indica]|uniref:Uncharacterized protein n=1 Tax=Tilletia indica TaxID=43049 RepID=A0A8T8SFK9_9BASI|nr:hypothetical protein CF326_g5211 [Tilletia indica]KAE8239122.1 hypothetical protein A4X13_0g8243 [Tilletia indica]